MIGDDFDDSLLEDVVVDFLILEAIKVEVEGVCWCMSEDDELFLHFLDLDRENDGHFLHEFSLILLIDLASKFLEWPFLVITLI
jgi:hypothetical protein